MSWVSGGATGDDITTGGNNNGGVNGGAVLVMGWFQATTLTAGRGYASFGNTCGLYVDTTTANLRIKTDNTTDGEWTAPIGIVTNAWRFLAWLGHFDNTGPTANHRIWFGDVHSFDEITVTSAVAPVGNFTGNGNRYLGNIGTGTVAFQGLLGAASFIAQANKGINSPLGLTGTAVIANSDADRVLNRWVRPWWRGDPDLNFQTYETITNALEITHFAMNRPCLVYRYNNDPGVTAQVAAATVNGMTWSEEEPPNAPPENWPVLAPYPRSRR